MLACFSEDKQDNETSETSTYEKEFQVQISFSFNIKAIMTKLDILCFSNSRPSAMAYEVNRNFFVKQAKKK